MNTTTDKLAEALEATRASLREQISSPYWQSGQVQRIHDSLKLADEALAALHREGEPSDEFIEGFKAGAMPLDPDEAELTITAPNGDKIVARGSKLDMLTLDRIVKAAAAAPLQASSVIPAEPVAIRRRTIAFPGTPRAFVMGHDARKGVHEGWAYLTWTLEEEAAQRESARLFVGDSAVPVRTEVEVLYVGSVLPDSSAPDMRAICEKLGFDPTNHHNAAKCPYCRPVGSEERKPLSDVPADANWKLSLTCCGRDNGVLYARTWEDADQSPGIHIPNRSAHSSDEEYLSNQRADYFRRKLSSL